MKKREKFPPEIWRENAKRETRRQREIRGFGLERREDGWRKEKSKNHMKDPVQDLRNQKKESHTHKI